MFTYLKARKCLHESFWYNLISLPLLPLFQCCDNFYLHSGIFLLVQERVLIQGTEKVVLQK